MISVGGSKSMTIPAELEKGESVTFAANRLMLADVRGEIAEDDLLRLLESIEPRVWRLVEKRKQKVSEAGG